MIKDNAVYPHRARVEIDYDGDYRVYAEHRREDGTIGIRYHGYYIFFWAAKRAAKKAMKRPVYIKSGVVFQIEN